MAKIKGGVFVTEVENQEVVDSQYANNKTVLTKCSVENIGESECNVKINGGDEILLRAGEYLELDIDVESVVVKEVGATVRVVGVE